MPSSLRASGAKSPACPAEPRSLPFSRSHERDPGGPLLVHAGVRPRIADHGPSAARVDRDSLGPLEESRLRGDRHRPELRVARRRRRRPDRDIPSRARRGRDDRLHAGPVVACTQPPGVAVSPRPTRRRLGRCRARLLASGTGSSAFFLNGFATAFCCCWRHTSGRPRSSFVSSTSRRLAVGLLERDLAIGDGDELRLDLEFARGPRPDLRRLCPREARAQDNQPRQQQQKTPGKPAIRPETPSVTAHVRRPSHVSKRQATVVPGKSKDASIRSATTGRVKIPAPFFGPSGPASPITHMKKRERL